MDLTTIAHHLSLLELPPPLDAALRSGRCAAPRTLYELNKIHGERPQAVVELLNSKVNAALAAAEVKEHFLKVGNEPVGGGPDVLAAKVQAELQKWPAIVRAKNIRIEQ